MSLKNKEKPTTLLTDKAAEKSKRTVNFLLVLMMMFQLIFPVAMSVSASSENDADNPGSEEVQEENIESPMTTMQAVEDEGDNNEAEETAQEPAETPPAPAEETPPADEGVTEPVAPENTEEQSNAPPAEEAPAEVPEEVETPEDEETVDEEITEEVDEELPASSESQTRVAILQVPNSYTSDPNYPSVLLSGVSINSHTRPHLMWRGADGYIYFAVKSTHQLDRMIIPIPGGGSVTNIRGNSDYPDYEYAEGASITVDNVTYAPEGLQGNVKNARWTVFAFPVSVFSESGRYTLTVHGIGGGHDVTSDYTVVVPKVTATLNKTWDKGPGSEVEIGLYARVVGQENWTLIHTINLTPVDQGDGTFFATYYWDSLDYTDAAGRRYEYEARETDPGTNYKSEMTTNYNAATRHYTFTLINTYEVPQINLTVIKNWKGGPPADHVPVDIKLWRTSSNQPIEQVTGIDPIITPNPGEYQTSSTYTYVWENLPEETDAGVPYTYYYTEEGLDSNRYDRIYDNSTTIGGVLYGTFTSFKGTVTNKYKIPKTEVEATKEWVGGEKVRPDLWFQLRRVSTVDGETVDEAVEVKELPKTGNTVTINFSELDETDFNGNKYTFYVVEGTYDGSTFTEAVPENFVKTENAEKLVLTNTYEIPTQDIQTVKYWENGEKVRPDLWYQLRRKLIINNEVLSDVPVGIQQVPADGDTVDILFEDVDQTDFNGSKYTFYVVEGVYDGETFTAIEEDTIYEDFLVERVNELAFKNSYQITETTATATKRWMGSNPSDFEEVEYTLWRTQKTGDFIPADFEVVEVIPTVTQSTEDPSVYYYSWSVESTDSTGNAYYYYFAEDEVPPGFQRIYSDDAIDVDGTQYEPSGGTIINKQLTIDFNFTKVDESGEPLQGAEFTLESEDGEDSIANTGTDPEFIFAGLTEGRYILRETKAPAGYSLPTTTWIIEVIRNEAGALEIVIPDDSFLNAIEEGNQLINKQQGEFPQTGGIGVASYIGVGMLAIMVSIGFYIKKEKNGGYQDE